MSSDHTFWHARYQQQAGWTLETRKYIFNKIGISLRDHLLEVGCGSGAVLETLKRDGYSNLLGIDRYLTTLSSANIPHPCACADGLHIPFTKASFAHCMCHFYLLWVSDPIQALREMARVTKPGGWVLSLAEPDYGGRISYPDILDQIADLQTRSLELQGANVRLGRRLRHLFTEIGLEDIYSGIIAAQWTSGTENSLFMEDMGVLSHDLADVIDQSELDTLLSQAEDNTSADVSVWFVPIFYAFGRVPQLKKG